MATNTIQMKMIGGMALYTLLWSLPTAAEACVKPSYFAQQCPVPKRSTTTCKSLAQKICGNGQAGLTAKPISSPCMVGSCINPKGKTKEEWMRMSKAEREKFIVAMPRKDFEEFQSKRRDAGRQ